MLPGGTFKSEEFDPKQQGAHLRLRLEGELLQYDLDLVLLLAGNRIASGPLMKFPQLAEEFENVAYNYGD